MGSPLGPSLVNSFLCDKFKPVYYGRYVDNIFVLFKPCDYLIRFKDHLNKCHPNMKFSFEEEKNGKLSFLDVEVSRKGNKFATTVCPKPTFSGVDNHFDNFLPTTYKFSMIYNLVFRCFSICSNWTNFHNELVFLKDIFFKNGYPISFIDKCFKTFLDQLYLKRPQVLIAEKKTLTLVLNFLGKLSLQTRTKLQKVLKRTLSCSKIQIVFKNQINLSNVFRFNDRLPYFLWCINFNVEDAMLPIVVKLPGT